MPIRVALADDHVLVRQGLKSLLEREEFKVVAEAADGQEAVSQAASLHPDIAIMDISMPMLNGIDAARELGRSCPKTKVILLTQHEEDRSEEHTSELQSPCNLVCRLLLEKKKKHRKLHISNTTITIV